MLHKKNGKKTKKKGFWGGVARLNEGLPVKNSHLVKVGCTDVLMKGGKYKSFQGPAKGWGGYIKGFIV